MEDLSHLLHEIKTQISNQKQDFLEIKNEITNSVIDHIDKIILGVMEKYAKLEENFSKQEKAINYLEKVVRRKNIIFFGIEEEECNYQDLENKILNIMNRTMGLNLDNNCLEFVGRMGKNKNKLRPVIVTLTTLGKKIEVLKRKNTLRDSNYYIQEDFTKDVLEKKKELRKQLDEQRKQGKNAFLKYDKLIISETDSPSPKPDLNTNKKKLSPSLDMGRNMKHLKQKFAKKNK